MIMTLMYYVDFYNLFNNPEKDWQILLSKATEDTAYTFYLNHYTKAQIISKLFPQKKEFLTYSVTPFLF